MTPPLPPTVEDEEANEKENGREEGAELGFAVAVVDEKREEGCVHGY